MAKDTISTRLKEATDLMWEAQDTLGGSSPAEFFAITEPRASTFKRFFLDPKSPRDREFLLRLLDEIIFSKGKVGAPKRWSDWDQGKLEMDVAAVNHGLKKKMSAHRIVSILMDDTDKKFKGRYKDQSSRVLRGRVGKIIR